MTKVRFFKSLKIAVCSYVFYRGKSFSSQKNIFGEIDEIQKKPNQMIKVFYNRFYFNSFSFFIAMTLLWRRALSWLKTIYFLSRDLLSHIFWYSNFGGIKSTILNRYKTNFLNRFRWSWTSFTQITF